MTKYLAAVAVLSANLCLTASAAVPAPSTPAAIVAPEACQPTWPTSSIDKHESGTVKMQVLVGADGRASDVKIAQSSGYRELDRASVTAMAKCRFTPASTDTPTVANWFSVEHEWVPGRGKTLPAPRFDTCAKPAWPKEALRYEYQGKVTLAFLIGEDGAVRTSRVEQSSGYPILDLAAQEGLEHCVFKPGTEDGKPYAGWTKMQYVWTLEKPNQEKMAAALVQARESAARGEATGQYNLGQIYLNGQGVSRDDAEGMKWVKKAADQGLASAQESMGIRAMSRPGEAGNVDQAETWLRKAAEQGLANSQYFLAMSLLRKDKFDEAITWLRKAAQQNNASAQSMLGLILLKRSPPNDQAKAITLLGQAAAQNDRNAQVALAKSYETGLGVAQDYGQAATLYRKAAVAGNREAQRGLAHLYEDGLGVPKDTAKAQQLLQDAASVK